jgi:MoaA/NifB/PqqE/SkfB family radical SAM enzyme
VHTDGNWWNSEYLREFRKSMFSYDTLSDVCKRCYDRKTADDPGYSLPFDLKDYNPKTGEVYAPPKQVLVFTGTKCDLACDMCDSTFSDTHAKVYPDRIIDIDVVTEDSARHIIGRYNPEQVVIYGGEPFVSRELYPLVQLALMKRSSITFLTNGNRDLAKHPVFKELVLPNATRFSFIFSIDGTADVNEQIRKGVRTEQILSNVELCRSEKIWHELHFTCSKLNAHNLTAFVRWVLSLECYMVPFFSLSVGIVDFPDDYRASTLPMGERLSISRDLCALKEEINSAVDAGTMVFTPKQFSDLMTGLDGTLASLDLE